MKKILIIILAILAIFSVILYTGCSGEKDEPVINNSDPDPGDITDTSEQSTEQITAEPPIGAGLLDQKFKLDFLDADNTPLRDLAGRVKENFYDKTSFVIAAPPIQPSERNLTENIKLPRDNDKMINAVIGSFNQVAEFFNDDDFLYLILAWNYENNDENFGLFIREELRKNDFLLPDITNGFLAEFTGEYLLKEKDKARSALNSALNGVDNDRLNIFMTNYNIELAVKTAVPEITEQPKDGTVTVGDTLILSVKAYAGDGGELGYQWFDEAGKIDGAENDKYEVTKSETGKYTFYAEVTNYGDGIARPSQPAKSETVTVTVEEIVAGTPRFTISPSDMTIRADEKINLSAAVVVDDGGIKGAITYQWYDAKTGKNLTEPSVNAEFSVNTLISDIYKDYEFNLYVIAINTVISDQTVKTAKAESEPVKITVKGMPAIIDADMPKVSVTPNDAFAYVNDRAIVLKANATVSDGGSLSYQWYSVDVKTGFETKIAGANSSSYEIKTDKLLESWFCVQVTNSNPEVTGLKTASKESDLIRVSIFEEKFRAIVEEKIKISNPDAKVNLIYPGRIFFRRNIWKFITGNEEYDQDSGDEKNPGKNNDKPDDDSNEIVRIKNIVDTYILNDTKVKVTDIYIYGHVDWSMDKEKLDHDSDDYKKYVLDAEYLARKRAERVEAVLNDLLKGLNYKIEIHIDIDFDQTIDSTREGRQSATIVLVEIQT